MEWLCSSGTWYCTVCGVEACQLFPLWYTQQLDMHNATNVVPEMLVAQTSRSISCTKLLDYQRHILTSSSNPHCNFCCCLSIRTNTQFSCLKWACQILRFQLKLEVRLNFRRQLRVGLGQIIFNELMPFRLWMKGTSGRKKKIFYILHIQIIKWITQRNERNLLRREMQNIQDDWFFDFYTSEFLFSDL